MPGRTIEQVCPHWLACMNILMQERSVNQGRQESVHEPRSLKDVEPCGTLSGMGHPCPRTHGSPLIPPTGPLWQG